MQNDNEAVWEGNSVSFIMPAYNCEATITESLMSIIDGNYASGDEIIVTNDCSTDRTPEILESMRNKYHFIKVVHHTWNRGGAAARNSAVAHADNQLIFCLDSDNILVEGSVRKLKGYLQEQKADVGSFQELHYFRDTIADITHKWIFNHGVISIADCFVGGAVPIASGNYMFTKDSWKRAGGYPEFAGALDAWGFGVRQLATGSKMVVHPDSHYYHRYGHESYWVRDMKSGKISLIALQIIIPYLDLFEVADVDYIMGRKGRYIWFQQRDVKPLRLKSGETGSAGRVVNLEGAFLEQKNVPRHSGQLIASLGERIRALFA